MKDFSFISVIMNEKLHECGVLWFSFKGTNRTSPPRRRDDVCPVDSHRQTRTSPYSLTYSPTIRSTSTPTTRTSSSSTLRTSFFEGEERRLHLCSCGTQTPHSLVSAPGVLSLVNREKVDHPNLFAKAYQMVTSTECVSNFYCIRMQPPSLQRETQPPLPDPEHYH